MTRRRRRTGRRPEPGGAPGWRRRRRPPARWPLVGLAAVFAMVIAVGAAQRLAGGGPEPPTGGPGGPPTTAPPPPTTEPPPTTVVTGPWEAPRPPERYALTYRVELFGPDGSPAAVDTERRVVVLPFRSRTEVLRGEPDAPGAPVSLEVAGLGWIEAGALDGQRVTLAHAPVVAPGHVGLRPDLRAAEAAGLARLTDQGHRMLGRTCRVVVLAGPLEVGDLEPLGGSGSRAELCVDTGNGLVLREAWTVDGRLTRRRTAVDLDLAPVVDADAFAPTGRSPGPQGGGGAFGPVTADSRPPGVVSWSLPAPPPGFRVEGRYVYRNPGVTDLGGPPGPVVGEVVEVLVAGTDALVVANGGTLDGSAPFDPPAPETAVDLGALGVGERRWGRHWSEVRALTGDGRYVRIGGTLAMADVEAVAASLVPVGPEGGDVRPLGGPPSDAGDGPDSGTVTCHADADGVHCHTGDADHDHP